MRDRHVRSELGHVRSEPISRTTPSGILADVLRVWDTVAEASDPLDAEMFGSQFLGKLSENGDAVTGFEPEPGLVLDLLAYAERTPSPAALALARTMSAIATTEGQRDAAARATDALLASGTPDPPWGTIIGWPTSGRCWTMNDATGDQVTVLLEFSYAEARHALMFIVGVGPVSAPVRLATKSEAKRTGPHAAVTGIRPAADPNMALHDLRRAAAASNGRTALAEADPARGAELIHNGIKATDMTLDPEVEDSYRRFRALALARCRLFPQAADVDPMSDDDRPPTDPAWRPTSPGESGLK